MKKLLIGMLAIICSVIGFQKMADKFDVTIKNNAIDSERNIASNGGGFPPKGRGNDGEKGKKKA